MENPMQTIRTEVSRRDVIENYAKYDYRKKHSSLSAPDFEQWDWSNADAIDAFMCESGLKKGVPAGFELWDEVSLTVDDLRECAVVDGINKKLGTNMRMLGDLDAQGFLQEWQPPSHRDWYVSISSGTLPDDIGPMLLRPAVRCESPAKYYIEDGSGRGAALVKHGSLFNPSAVVAVGFLGKTIDRESRFMFEHLRELLRPRP
jgi:hypothetical protein